MLSRSDCQSNTDYKGYVTDCFAGRAALAAKPDRRLSLT
jgi:hypothetical protein